MATTRFKTTLDAIKGGVKNFTIEKAVQNIEGWESYLEKHDHEGVKAVVQDLAKLKKLLQAKEIDGETVKKLVAKMGKDTVKVAGDGDNAEAKHIRELGEALSEAASKADDEKDEVDDEVDENEGDEVDEDEDDEVDEDEDDEEADDEDESEEDNDTAETTKAKPAKKAAKKSKSTTKK